MLEAPDDRLVALLGHDQGESLAVLVRRHTPTLYGPARRLAGDGAAAEDLLQDMWLRLLLHPPSLAPGQSVVPWLRRVLVHLAVDRARGRAARPSDPSGLDPAPHDADPAPTPDALALRAEGARRMRAALDRLPADYRVVLILLHAQQWSVREVAHALGLPATVVKNRALRGRRRLRATLAEMDREEVSRRVPPTCSAPVAVPPRADLG